MSADDNQQRYDDILKRIANRKPFGQPVEEKSKSTYDLILDYLNTYDTFATLTLKSYKRILCYGPQVIRKPGWTGVISWYLNKGYHGYQKLWLLGVWAHPHNTDILVTLGRRELKYRAAVYNPEGFHASIRKDFKLFYDDDGHPPTVSGTILLQAAYKAKERLTLRQTLQSSITQWQHDMEAD